MTPANQPSPPSPASVADLEMRIDPERTLDLFTMTPKVSRNAAHVSLFETDLAEM